MIACWNLKQNRGARVLPGLAAIEDADVVGLLECNGNLGAVAAWRKEFSRNITGSGFEGRSSALLIRRGVPVHDRGRIVVNQRWRGPRGGLHTGRAFPWATVTLDGQRVTVVVVHMPWGRFRNWRAWRACFYALLRFALAHKGPLVFVGDFNQLFRAGGLWSILRLAKRAHMAYTPTGSGLDYALTRDINLHGRQLGRFGSDHHATRYVRSTR